MAGRARVGRTGAADLGAGGRLPHSARPDPAEGHHPDAELRRRAHAARTAVSRRRCGAHRPADRRQGPQPRRRRCALPDRGAGGMVPRPVDDASRPLLGALPPPRLEGAALLVVDDHDAPPESGGFGLRPEAPARRTRLRHHVRSRHALARRELCRPPVRAAGPQLTMTFSALDSALTAPLFASDAIRAVFSDRARIAAMLQTETALARAEAKAGLVPAGLARALEGIAPDDLDAAALGAKTADAGVVAIPFVKAVEARLPEKLRGWLHFGATSQDIVDAATALLARDGLALIDADVAAVLAGLAKLARAHRRTRMAGRTYGQHAAPVTFGYVAATWLSGIAE